MTTNILEESKLLPEHSFSLPLGLFDLVWCRSDIRILIFFKFPCTKSHFMNTIVPELKRSLALTLTHFPPFAGKIILPLNKVDKPILHYESGDSLPFIVSESDADFYDLTGNHPRPCDDFYAFVPNLPPATHSEKTVVCPVFALQVTLFPGQGISIGNIMHHGVADASTYVRFMLAWALINRTNMHECGEDNNIQDRLREANCVPFFDRKTVMDPDGLFSLLWKSIDLGSRSEPLPVKLPIHKHRATFVLKKEVIQKLKEFVLAKCPDVTHLSSFTVSCALAWVCYAKSAAPEGLEVADDEPEYFCFIAELRARLDPPLPANYFGNCIRIVCAKLKHGEVKGSDGLMVATKAIAHAIKEKVYSDKGVLHGADKWQEERDEMIGIKRQYWVSGSPKFDFYKLDFGWGGKPNKFEILATDGGDGRMSFSNSRDSEGGIEIGISKTMAQMDAFTKIFSEHVDNLIWLMPKL